MRVFKSFQKSFLLFLLLLFTLFNINSVRAEEFVAVNADTGTKYATLQAAVNAVDDNQTIELAANIQENLVLDIDKKYTIDLNDFVIDGNMQDTVITILKGTVTIENGALEKGKKTGFSGPTTYGGGIYVGSRNISVPPEKTINVTLNNIIVEDCTAGDGGGIFLDENTNTEIKDTKIFNCSSDKKTAALNVSGKTASLKIEDSYIYDNYLTNSLYSQGSIINITGSIEAQNCYIQNNYTDVEMDTSTSYYHTSILKVYLNNDESVKEFKECYIQNNYNVVDTTYIERNGDPVVFDNCSFTGNRSGRVGAIYLTDGSVQLVDSVIKDNTASETSVFNNASPTGGVSVTEGSTLEMTSGAIYGNESGSLAKDIFIEGYNTKVDVLDASLMKDGDTIFSTYIWRHSDLNSNPNIKDFNYLKTNDPDNINGSTSYQLRAIPKHEEVAEYKGEISKLPEAVEKAKTDYLSGTTTEAINLKEYSEDKSLLMLAVDSQEITTPITINLNSFALMSDVTKNTFKVSGETGSLKLVGEGSVYGSIILEDNGSLELENHFQGDLEIISNNLSKQTIKGSNNFTCDGKINITINDPITQKQLEGLNTLEEDVILIDGVEPDFDLDKVEVHNIDNPNVKKEIKDSKIILTNVFLDGVFVDSSSSNGDGDSPDAPASSLEAVIENINNSPEEEATVYLLDTYEVKGHEELVADKPITIVRVSDTIDQEKKPMFSVGSNAQLTLNNVCLDGNSVRTEENKDNISLLENCGSIIDVKSGGKVVIEDDTILQNNDISKTDLDLLGDTDRFIPRMGGAIYATGTVEMNGGTIQNCYALEGGGIFLYNRSAVLYMNGGLITNNHAEDINHVDKLKSSGGGVAILDDAKMYMTKGTISNNSALNGGGIAVGLGEYSLTSSSDEPNLVIQKNDEPQSIALDENEDEEVQDEILIDNNTSVKDGGGIFVQSSYQAWIYDGSITNNHSLSGNFGGGGIYVNGGKNHVENGILYLKNTLITDNFAKEMGGGIAGCPSARASLNRIDGDMIYLNHSKNRQGDAAEDVKDDIVVLTDPERITFSGTKQENKDDYISSLMLDGTPYHWQLVGTDRYATEDYLDSNTGKHLYTNSTPQSLDLIKVRITGNTAETKGGGIGTNGTVIIGDEEFNESDASTFNVIKNWEGLPEGLDKPLGLTQLNIWLFADKDGEVSYITNQTIYKESEHGNNDWINHNKTYFYNIEEVSDYGEPIIIEECIFDDIEHIWSNNSNYSNDDLADIIGNIMETNYDLSKADIIWGNTDESPYFVKLESNDDGDWTITNSILYGDLSLTKRVRSNTEDLEIPEQGFEFVITLTDKEGNTLDGEYSATYTKADDSTVTSPDPDTSEDDDPDDEEINPPAETPDEDEQEEQDEVIDPEESSKDEELEENTETTEENLEALDIESDTSEDPDEKVDQEDQNEAKTDDTTDSETDGSEQDTESDPTEEPETIVFKSGDTIYLKPDQTITIQDLPVGTSYQIVETSEGDFVMIPSEISGVIKSKDGESGHITSVSVTNYFGIPTGKLQIPIEKQIEGNPKNEDTFVFEISAPEDVDYGENVVMPTDPTTTIVGEGYATLGPIYFTETGEYSFNVKELPPDAVGYTIDKTIYTVNVSVIPDPNDRLNLLTDYSISMVDEEQEETVEADSIVFINIFDEQPILEKEQSSPQADKTKDPIISKPGQEMNYYLTVTNPTDEVMTNLIITDTIPQGLTYVKGSANYPVTVDENNTLTWIIESLPKGSQTLEFKVTVDFNQKVLQYDNQAHLSWEKALDIPSNTVTAYAPIIVITKEQETNIGNKTKNHLNIKRLDTITYTISVENIGDVSATEVAVMDKIPEGLNYVSSKPTATLNNGVLTWNLGEVKAGETVKLTVSFKIQQRVSNKTQFKNTAYASWKEYDLDDPTPSNEVISTVTTTETETGTLQPPNTPSVPNTPSTPEEPTPDDTPKEDNKPTENKPSENKPSEQPTEIETPSENHPENQDAPETVTTVETKPETTPQDNTVKTAVTTVYTGSPQTGVTSPAMLISAVVLLISIFILVFVQASNRIKENTKR